MTAKRLTALIAALMVGGCATMPARAPYTLSDLAAGQVMNAEAIRYSTSGSEQEYRLLGEMLDAQRKARGLEPPRTLLALSGGSDKGALSAGLLNAWTKRGDRPTFDIVTGVSTGALVAPFAFLGSDQDNALREIYTGIDNRNIYQKQLVSGLFGGASILNSAPLQALIARYVTPAFLHRIAAEHRNGRRLLVVTTNLDAEHGVIWDMGAIAASSDPGRILLFRQVLLASASIPGAFPPVLIESSAGGRTFSEMHVDGGAVGGFFVLPRAMLSGGSRSRSPGTFYLLYNGRFKPQFAVTKPRTFSILSKALNTVLGQMDRDMAEDIRVFAAERQAQFAMCAIEDDFTEAPAPLFNRHFMNALYAYGERKGMQADGCLSPAVPSQPAEVSLLRRRANKPAQF
jgi:hypothetical protein